MMYPEVSEVWISVGGAKLPSPFRLNKLSVWAPKFAVTPITAIVVGRHQIETPIGIEISYRNGTRTRARRVVRF
jgi:hypothetical protein